MTQQSNKDMLIRIDERTHNIWRAVEKIERHQETQNDSMAKANEELAMHATRIASNRIWVCTLRWVLGGILALGIALVTMNAQNLW